MVKHLIFGTNYDEAKQKAVELLGDHSFVVFSSFGKSRNYWKGRVNVKDVKTPKDLLEWKDFKTTDYVLIDRLKNTLKYKAQIEKFENVVAIGLGFRQVEDLWSITGFKESVHQVQTSNNVEIQYKTLMNNEDSKERAPEIIDLVKESKKLTVPVAKKGDYSFWCMLFTEQSQKVMTDIHTLLSSPQLSKMLRWDNIRVDDEKDDKGVMIYFQVLSDYRHLFQTMILDTFGDWKEAGLVESVAIWI